ncbi:MAG: recombinase family protein [Eubacteriales bacterium]|nr:recombinase family protein [Eubacteriales bacterium]
MPHHKRVTAVTVTPKGAVEDSPSAEDAPNTQKASPKPPLRAAAYCRVSTSMEAQEDSYAFQKKVYEQKIRQYPGYVLAGIYGDYGISGGNTKKRKGFQRLLKDCRSGKIDVVITKSISRFARNLSDSLNTIRELKQLGIPVIFEKEGLNTLDESSEILLSILSAIAQEELNSLSQNVKWSLNQSCASGNPSFRTCYGYRKKKEKNRFLWEIHPGEAKRVRTAFQMAEEGKKYWEICEALQAMEDSDGTSIQWCYAKVSKLLRHEAYMGDLLTGKHVTLDYLNKKEVKNKGQADQYYLEDHHPPIVTRQQFAAVQKNIRERTLCASYGEVPLRWKKQFQRNKKKTDMQLTGHTAKPDPSHLPEQRRNM